MVGLSSSQFRYDAFVSNSDADKPVVRGLAGRSLGGGGCRPPTFLISADSLQELLVAVHGRILVEPMQALWERLVLIWGIVWLLPWPNSNACPWLV